MWREIPALQCATVRRTRGRLVESLLAVTVCAGVGFSAVRGAPGAPNLDSKVTIRAPMTTLERLVRELSGQTGLSLSVAGELKDHTVLLVVQDRPGSEVMQNLASTLDFSWQRSGERGFLLVESSAGRTARLALEGRIQEVAAAEFDAHLLQADRFVRQFRDMAPSAVRDEIQRLRAVADALPSGPGKQERSAEAEIAAQAGDPNTRPLLEAVLELSPGVRASLRRGERVVLARSLPGAAPLSPGVAQALATGYALRTGGALSSPALELQGSHSWEGFTLTVRAVTSPQDPAPPRIALPRIMHELGVA